MEYGRPEERINEKRTVMETAFFVVKRMQVSIIYGGNAERSISTRTLAISNSWKLDTKSTTNRNVSGTLEESRHIGPPYQTRST
eukprot:11139409-Heterocapsa_arctica.AAC.1